MTVKGVLLNPWLEEKELRSSLESSGMNKDYTY